MATDHVNAGASSGDKVSKSQKVGQFYCGVDTYGGVEKFTAEVNVAKHCSRLFLRLFTGNIAIQKHITSWL